MFDAGLYHASGGWVDPTSQFADGGANIQIWRRNITQAGGYAMFDVRDEEVDQFVVLD